MGPKVVEGHILTKNVIKEVTKFELFWFFFEQLIIRKKLRR